MRHVIRARFGMLFAPIVAVVLTASTVADSPVADAAMRGDLETVRTLIAGGADVNASQGDGMTALHWAAENGDLEMVKTLLFAGAFPDAATRTAETLNEMADHFGAIGARVLATRSINMASIDKGAASFTARLFESLVEI